MGKQVEKQKVERVVKAYLFKLLGEDTFILDNLDRRLKQLSRQPLLEFKRGLIEAYYEKRK